jgi:Mg2+ and Co2+ transporter CorA
VIAGSAHLLRGARHARRPLSLSEAAARPRSGGSFVWLELVEPSDTELAALADGFGLHELALDDAARAHQRPKVEAYDDFHFLVFRTARNDPSGTRVLFGEVHVFLGVGFVIAIRHGDAPPLLAPIESVEAGAFRDVSPALLRYFRDAADNLRRIHEDVLAQRDQLAAVFDANVTLQAAGQTAIIKQLTVVATVFLPLGFIVGFFGQNFGWLTHHAESPAAFFGVGLGSLVLSTTLLFAWLRRAQK